MPLISIRLVAGRPREDLARLAAAVSDAAAGALDVPVERIGVHILELDADHVARGGRLLSDGDA